MRARSDMDGRVEGRAAHHSGNGEWLRLRLEFVEQPGLELGVLLLPLGMRESEMRGCRIQVTVAEDCPIDNVPSQRSQTLTSRDAIARAQLLDRHITPLSQDWMVTSQLHTNSPQTDPLRRAIRHVENVPATERRGVPPDHVFWNDVPAGIDGHDLPGIARSDKAADPFPTSVRELDLRRVSEAFQDIRDIDLSPREANPSEQCVEQLPRLADERHALLILVEARGLTDEHQVGVRVAAAEDDLRPACGERAARTAKSLVPVVGELSHGRDSRARGG